MVMSLRMSQRMIWHLEVGGREVDPSIIQRKLDKESLPASLQHMHLKLLLCGHAGV
jgi:hypothetical protein